VQVPGKDLCGSFHLSAGIKYQYHAYVWQKFKEYFIAPSVHVAMNVDEYPVSLLQ